MYPWRPPPSVLGTETASSTSSRSSNVIVVYVGSPTIFVRTGIGKLLLILGVAVDMFALVEGSVRGLVCQVEQLSN